MVKHFAGFEQGRITPTWGYGEETESCSSSPIKEIEGTNSPLKESFDPLSASVFGGSECMLN